MANTDTLPSRPSAEGGAGLISRVFIHWPAALVATGSKRALEPSDSLVPPTYDHLDRVTPAFERAWARRRDQKDGLRRALYDTYRRRFWFAAFVFFAYQICATLGPLLVRELIQWFEGSGRGVMSQGLLIAAALGLFHMADSLAHKHQWSEAWKTTHSINALLRTQILRKYLRMDRGVRLTHPAGDVVTFASRDSLKAGQLAFFHMAWAVPLGVAGSCVILCVLLGWAGLAGLAVLIGGLQLSNMANERLYAVEPDVRDANSVRIGLVGEYLGAMRTLRSHSWEDVAERAVTRERAKLNGLLVGRQKRLATLYLVNAATPVLMVTATLVTYVALGGRLHAADVFAAIAVLTVLRSQLPELVRYFDLRNGWRVALGKISAFLDAPDADASDASDVPAAGSEAGAAHAPAGTVQLTGASFAWPGKDEQATPCLEDVDLRIAPGELVCVLGKVGSGKTALLGALAGTMRTLSGTARTHGSTVYLPQRPWVMQASAADNIRCFAPHDPERYAAVLRATALDTDLAALPAGDATVLGERGTTLSGGQRQRIALARAAYEDADVYLVDDPTSAVDDAVATRIINTLFSEVLGGRTRIVATHRLDLARRADRVVVLDGGRVVAVGTFDEVQARMPELLPEAHGDAAERAAAETADAAGEATEAEAGTADETAEPVRSGTVLRDTYRGYLRVLTPGVLLAVLVALAVAGQSMLGASSFWLGRWTEHTDADTVWYAGVFAGIGLLTLVLDRTLFTFGFSRGVKAGKTLHDSMLTRVLRAPLSFFEKNSSGRVLTRFSADTETIDLELPEYTMDTLKIAVGMVVPLLALAFTSPVTAIFTPVVLLVYLRWQRRTRSSTVEASRLAKQAKEPVIALLTEAIEGVASIEGREARVKGYEATFRGRAQAAHYADYTVNSLSRHFNLRLDLVGALVLFGYAALLVVQGGIGAGYAGVGVSFVYMLIETLAMSLMTVQMMDLALASYERVHDYTQLPVESEAGLAAPEGWPSAGDIRFEDVTLRYAPGAPAALDGITFHAPAGRKTGVEGRTGSGKSSLFTALLRITECERGRILIDGVDISTLRLRDLRSRIETIPQDPVLLPGTLRENLDPYGSFSDAELESALEKVGLAGKLLALPDGLAHNATSGGAQLSTGERQLLCLARALLSRARIVLVDEATANLDAETDARIQRTFETELKGCTVLVIAHRRDVLLDADRVVRLDGGRIARITENDDAPSATGVPA
ncbi:ATP-binding cassette domain-containing protein [Streptomyces sp. NBC_00193]|uniref:ATP-binding cassette domain-containing protein n=1 Tax=unclassified Streptomyces TaxID=2593676 RepID=UPI002252E785|nr:MULTISPECIES: ATP-binding cassette domain-containing protein [unclassified Streptomyces]MCX5124651.1 ATP-binding cassette domain-containing protein [Streptomyces sp. NBC_00347]MCX5297829.1 ATP-binding cassette domain-containing protein [Streptomyces sp. NBC_00193]